MKNYWVQKDDWPYGWSCTFDPRKVSRADLSEFAVFANELLEREQLLVVDSFDHWQKKYQYRRGADGSMAVFCQRLFDEHGIIQFPSANIEKDNSVTATMAYYDTKDRIVENPIRDLGVLLRELEPIPGAILKYMRYRGKSPLVSSGSALSLSDLEKCDSVGFALHSYSNIWSPYIWSRTSAHPWDDQRFYFDNRELAQRHTARLNRAIADLADATTMLGGTWSMRESGPFATERGIDLNPVLDALLAPEGADLVEWPDKFEEGFIVPMDERDYEYGR